MDNEVIKKLGIILQNLFFGISLSSCCTNPYGIIFVVEYQHDYWFNYRKYKI